MVTVPTLNLVVCGANHTCRDSCMITKWLVFIALHSKQEEQRGNLLLYGISLIYIICGQQIFQLVVPRASIQEFDVKQLVKITK